ncbi:MAG: hypothetical protein ACK5TV_03285, partial [Phycisphaerales bacterium]
TMSIVPDKIEALLTFVNDRSAQWEDQSTLLQIPPAELTLWQNAITAATASFDAASKARANAKAATLTQTANITALRRSTARLIAAIRLTAERSSNPDSIYAAALLPPPENPSSRPAPEAATDLRATLDFATGQVTLRWKARNNTGSVYLVSRASIAANGAVGPTVAIGSSGKKSFVDESVPAGVAGVQYTLRAQRGGLFSPVVTLTVRFGAGAGGITVVTSTEQGDQNATQNGGRVKFAA